MPVKVSVFLAEDIHQRLKLASVQSGTSIQEFMETAAQKLVQPEVESRPSHKEIRMWQAKLKNILENGDHFARLNCTAAIESMNRVVQARQAQRSKTIASDNQAIENGPVSEPQNSRKPQEKSERKAG